jgi:hypothetical protein
MNENPLCCVVNQFLNKTFFSVTAKKNEKKRKKRKENEF